jgi:hypothetical protein
MTDRRGRRCTNRASECTLLGILHLPFAVVYSVVQRASLRSRVRSVAYISRIERADERTRTADLLITSDKSSVARGSLAVQNPCKAALIYLKHPSATPSPALPVVSEW